MEIVIREVTKSFSDKLQHAIVVIASRSSLIHWLRFDFPVACLYRFLITYRLKRLYQRRFLMDGRSRLIEMKSFGEQLAEVSYIEPGSLKTFQIC